MEWLNTLIKKLPTLKGIADFFYVATHWSTVSTEREEYRRQIKEREEWLTAHKENLKSIHELEKERMTKEFEEQLNVAAENVDKIRAAVEGNVDKLSKLREETKAVGTLTLQVLDLYYNAVTRLAIFYHFDPLLWEIEREQEIIKPELRKIIETTIARLPPLPPTPNVRKTLPTRKP
jgi:hypothetical protein